MFKNRAMSANKCCSDDTLRGIATMLKDGESHFLADLVKNMSKQNRTDAVQVLNQKGAGKKSLPIVRQLVPHFFPAVRQKEEEMENIKKSVDAVYAGWEFYITKHFMTPWGFISTEGILTVITSQDEADEMEDEEERGRREVEQQVKQDFQNRLNSTIGGRVLKFVAGDS